MPPERRTSPARSGLLTSEASELPPLALESSAPHQFQGATVIEARLGRSPAALTTSKARHAISVQESIA